MRTRKSRRAAMSSAWLVERGVVVRMVAVEVAVIVAM